MDYIISFISACILTILLEIDRLYIRKQQSEEKILKQIVKNLILAFVSTMVALFVFRHFSYLFSDNKQPFVFTTDPEF
jgi:hypothetical protein